MTDFDVDFCDSDSLFGSPPSSPQLSPTDVAERIQLRPTSVQAPASEVRGRSSSLALPCSSHGAGMGDVGVFMPKNVGTIALPGSQNGAETIVVLPASPPRGSTIAESSTMATTATASSNCSRSHLVQVTTNASTKTNSTRTRSSSHKKRRDRAVQQVVESPVFTLPTDSTPLPSNFLRNQQALLGLAGVIAGLHPARLSTSKAKGASAQNPIVIDDSTSIDSGLPRVDRNQLPVPSGTEIASILMQQKEILPLLKSLLPYLSGKGTREAGSLQDDHIAKKRRTEKELERWEKGKEKKLLIQLVRIVKEAVQKATSKPAVMEEPLQTGVSDTTATQAQHGSSESSSAQSLYPVETNTLSYVDWAGSFDMDSTASSPPLHTYPQPSSLFGDVDVQPAPSSFIDMDTTSLFNLEDDLKSWLESLGDTSFQESEMACSYTRDSSFSVTETNSPLSTRLPTPVDPSLFGLYENKENDVPQILTDSSVDVRVASELDFSGLGFDISVDPLLFGLCEQPTSMSTTVAPIPAETLPSITFEGSPSLNHSTQDVTGSLQTNIERLVRYLLIPSAPISPPPPPPIVPSPLPPLPTTVIAPPIAPPIQSPACSTSVINRQGPILIGPSLYEEQSMPFINLFPSPSIRKTLNIPSAPNPLSTITRHLVTNLSKPTKKLDRETILKRARARREQLVAEIARAKVELWETTIEQGVLVHLSKDKSIV